MSSGAFRTAGTWSSRLGSHGRVDGHVRDARGGRRAHVILLGERFSWHEPVGAVLVLLGILLAQGRLGMPRQPGRGMRHRLTLRVS